MTNILITGAAGNIGSSLVAGLLKDDNFFIVGIDNLSTGHLSKLPTKDSKKFIFIKADANNFDELSIIFLKYNIEYVFHFAAVVGVERTLSNPLLVLNDIEGIKSVLNLSKNTNVKRVFYSSSSEVYGEPVSLPQHEETTPLNSKLPYAIVKNLGEAYFRSYEREFGLKYTIFRFFNTYGPNQSELFVIAKFLKLALANKDITIYGDGFQTRTFCFVNDNVDTMILALKNGLMINETINIGSDLEYTILELAEKVISISKSKSKIVHLPALDEGDMTRRQPDISKMKKILNREFITLEQGIEIMIKSGNFQ